MDESETDPRRESPPLHPNLRLFVLFRICFNCRFYYPVYMILFLDFGLSMEQFGILNAVWALTIVLLEVPSGALADSIGRRTLVVIAAVLMILELVCLAVAPVGSWLVFYLFLMNRILSGAAEAAASGADEALAYDSIPPDNREDTWSRLISRMMIWMSICSVAVMTVGALVYDENIVNGVLSFLGFSTVFESSDTIRFPILLNILMAIGALVVALRMQEVPHLEEHRPKDVGDLSPPSAGEDSQGDQDATPREPNNFHAVFEAGRWILKTPAALVLILLGLCFDSIIRLYYTVNSNVLRVLEIPEYHFGIISAAGALLGIVAALAVKPIHNRTSPSGAFSLVAGLIVVGLIGFVFPIPIYGVLLLVPFWFAMRFLHYFLSQYLNQITPSRMRATVLSFRGLSMNISYGFLTLMFSVQTWLMVRPEEVENHRDLDVFARAIQWWLPYFLLALVLLFGFIHLRYRKSVTKLLRKQDAFSD